VTPSEGHLGAIANRCLVRVRQLYETATVQSDQGTDFGAFQATLLFDLSVEQFLRAASVHLKCPSDNRDPKFKELWDVVEKAQMSQGGRGLPLKTEILHSLRPARNMAQHQGDAPSRSTVERYREYVGEFLRQSVDEVFGLKWDELSPLRLVRDREVRSYLQLAEEFMEEGETLAAVKYLAVVHYLIREKLAEPFGTTGWQDRVRDLVPRISRRLNAEQEPESEGNDFESLWRALSEELRNLRMRIRLVQAGISLDSYERLLDGLPFIVTPYYRADVELTQTAEGPGEVISLRGLRLGPGEDLVTRQPTYPREDDGVPKEERFGYVTLGFARLDQLPPPPTEKFCIMALTLLADIATRIPIQGNY